ncbi:hypothetical protein D1872_164710 [compost metagenome]
MKKTVMINGDKFNIDGNRWICKRNKRGFRITLTFAETDEKNEEVREVIKNFVAKHML